MDKTFLKTLGRFEKQPNTTSRNEYYSQWSNNLKIQSTLEIAAKEKISKLKDIYEEIIQIVPLREREYLRENGLR